MMDLATADLATLDAPVIKPFDSQVSIQVGLSAFIIALAVALVILIILYFFRAKKRAYSSLLIALCLSYIVIVGVTGMSVSTGYKDWRSNNEAIVTASNEKINAAISKKYGVILHDPNFFNEFDFYDYPATPLDIDGDVTGYTSVTLPDGEKKGIEITTDILVSDVFLREEPTLGAELPKK